MSWRSPSHLLGDDITECPGVPCCPNATPTSNLPYPCELSTVSLEMGDDGPLCPQPKGGSMWRSSARFGAPSHSRFFCRNNPHPQRVRQIKGISGSPICTVSDLTFGPVPRCCLGRALTPYHSLLAHRTPAAAIGTNCPLFPIDVITGLQLFPLRQRDSLALQLLREAWCAELHDLTERLGLLGDSSGGGSGPSSPRSLCGSGRGGSRDKDEPMKEKLMQVVGLLSQILQIGSIGEVQEWLITAGQREKEQVVRLLSAALPKHQAGENTEQPGEKVLRVLSPPSRLTTISEERDNTREQLLEILSAVDSAFTPSKNDSASERPGWKTTMLRSSAVKSPKTPQTKGRSTACLQKSH